MNDNLSAQITNGKKKTITPKTLNAMLKMALLILSFPIDKEEKITGRSQDTTKAEDLDAYVDRAFKYLYDNGFYSTDGVINEDAIIKSFLNKYSKDSRFKKAEDLELGKQYEVKRIKAIYTNATILKRVFEENPDIFDDKQTTITSIDYTGRFAINLGKLTGGEKNVYNSFRRAVVNEETKEVTYTADGVYLLIGNKQFKNNDLHYEGLAYIVSVLKTYSNLI